MTTEGASSAVSHEAGRPSLFPRLCWLAFLIATILLYFPGLRGNYEFDDFPNIVDNTALHVDTLDPAAWIAAMWASPASDMQRPLASLSFSLNYYFTGLDPRPMKVTNLAIHLLNGCLLLMVLRRIIQIVSPSTPSMSARSGRGDWLAVLVAGTWLLHPINLTAVLFIVQRMESLAQTFVLLGLLSYVDARARQQQNRRGAVWRLWIGVPVCLVLGIATKESAALLPLYALILEVVVLSMAQRPSRELFAFYSIFLFIPGLLGLAWMVPHALAVDAYAQRAFTLTQRLLTEPRILLDYFAWTLLPIPGFFSFFRDDYPFSTDAWHPWTTVPAMLLLAAMVGSAWIVRTHRPLAALGIFWFFAAHALTGTLFPLELVFEHRNYFASAGLLLAGFDLVLPKDRSRASVARLALVGSFCVLCAFTLALRAREWSDPIRLAVTEAARHPTSPRASYELGRTYVMLSGYRKDSPNTDKAFEALERASNAPRASILPDVAMIMTASRVDRPIEDKWWDAMRTKLARRRPSVEDSSAIKSLTACQREGHCALDDAHMLDIYLAGLSVPPPDAGVLYSYSIFAFNRMHDPDLAMRLAREAADASHDPQYRINLANFMIDQGQFAPARAEIDRLRSRNRFGALDASIAELEKRVSARQDGED